MVSINKQEIIMANEKAPDAAPVVLGEDKSGWGVENMPNPKGVALIQARWDLCIGCGACEAACSMFHYGTINRELSRIRIYRYHLPIPKSVQNICCQCSPEERECEKACPIDPPVIHYDKEKFHMVVDEDRCLGSSCGQCAEACPAAVPRFYPPDHDYSMVCDLCERNGVRKPQCVEICPSYALEFLDPRFPQHLERIHPDDKALYLSKRLYPLPKDQVQRPPEEIWGD
jgi:Fe-S-cluster-containing hydrogenase component 2